MPDVIVLVSGLPPAVSRCQSCGAAIQWYRTPRGKLMPINAGAYPEPMESGPGGSVAKFDSSVAHWATCPDAKEWRRKK